MIKINWTRTVYTDALQVRILSEEMVEETVHVDQRSYRVCFANRLDPRSKHGRRILAVRQSG